MSEHEQHLRTVNDSGFPLQIKLAHLVGATSDQHGWSVRYTEHAWRSTETGEGGFIDLVLGDHNDQCVLVVECKRVRDVSWVFLAPSGKIAARRHGKPWATWRYNNALAHFGWHDLAGDPATPEALFCAIRGQSTNGSRPLLERVASDVVLSVEALARQEVNYHDKERPGLLRMYFGIIVTTAPLYVAGFDPADIRLTDGTLPDAEFKEVPFLRFRKQLLHAAEPMTAEHYEAPIAAERARESSVFVVNAEHLPNFLKEFDFSRAGERAFG